MTSWPLLEYHATSGVQLESSAHWQLAICSICFSLMMILQKQRGQNIAYYLNVKLIGIHTT